MEHYRKLRAKILRGEIAPSIFFWEEEYLIKAILTDLKVLLFCGGEPRI